jgi:large subunit ribosomal protein L9
MKLILSQDVPNVGKTGETVKVADGYARNYLLPRKLAMRVDSGNAKQIEHELRIIHMREEKRRAELAEVAKKIEALTLEFKVRAGAEDKIFGSVTSANIAEKLAEMGHTIDRKTMVLEEPIKALGIYAVPVRLAGGIEANVKVWVSAVEEAQPEVDKETTEAT